MGLIVCGMFFNVRESRHGDRVVLSVLGDVDLATLPELANRITRVDADELVIDLSSVDYFDPLCLGVLITAQRTSHRRGRVLAVVSPTGPTRAMLDECRMERLLTIRDTVEEVGDAAAGPTDDGSASGD